MDVAIIGGGIAGLAFALNLHTRGIACRVYEAAPEIRALGVGITLLPHATRELRALGLEAAVLAAGIENRESAFFNRFGQLIYREPRGKFAGYPFPEIGINRGRLHLILLEAVRERLGADAVAIDHKAVGFEQDADGVTLRFQSSASDRVHPPVRASIGVACDGFHSAIRRQLYPDDVVAFTGINTWRGVTRRKPILDGRTYLRVGSIRTGKMVIYPIADDVDADGNQLINWLTEITSDVADRNEWNRPGRLEDFYPRFDTWKFEWLDATALIRDADVIYEYPMVDRDPLPRWTFGRVTLAGDAAHPMYPRGSNGSAQALIDVRTLADLLAKDSDPQAALAAYEAARREATSAIVRTNRTNPPDFINIRVEELTGDQPFEKLDDHITQDELRALSDSYKRVAGFSLADVTVQARQ
jgi:2-polyprenyl-6-methoxyphenol hydroxylase-like FAD-dependent oxidoreductase